MFRRISAVLTLCVAAASAVAADFIEAPAIEVAYVSPFPRDTVGEYVASGYPANLHSMRHIRMEGMIEPGDAEKLRTLVSGADPFGSVVLSMHSPGGNFNAGLALGDAIAEASVTTFVGPGDVCLSACAFAFLGGRVMTIRHVLWEPSRVLHVGGMLGLHAPSIPGSVPEDLLSDPQIGAVLLADIARPTRENLQDLQRRAGEWEVSPDLIFELLGRVGEEEFFYIERWHEAYANKITVVVDALEPPPHMASLEAAQGCSLLLGTILWEADPSAPFPYFTGARDETLPGALSLRTGPANLILEETAGTGHVFGFSGVLPGRGSLTCEVRQEGGVWRARATGDLPTISRMETAVNQGGGLTLNAHSALGFGIPWSAIGAPDLYVRDERLLWEDLPPETLAAAETLDFCADAAPTTWFAICRFPVLHRSVAVLTALTRERSPNPEEAKATYARWTGDVGRFCRTEGADLSHPVAETMAGYCGLAVTHGLIRDRLRAWSEQ